VPVALGAADEAPPALVRDVAQLLDVHMDQRAGVGVFVAAYWITGDPVDVREAGESAAA
jgi:hypothetical protein